MNIIIAVAIRNIANTINLMVVNGNDIDVTNGNGLGKICAGRTLMTKDFSK